MKEDEMRGVSLKFMRKINTIVLCAAAFALIQIATAPNALADPILGSTLVNFAVLAGSTVTNTGPTTISGDVGVSPGSAITGFYGTTENDGPGTINSGTGTFQQSTGVANTAQSQLATALGNFAGLTSLATPIAGGNLSTVGSLTPGVYSVAAIAASAGGNLSGTLTLKGNGSANEAWVFLMPSTLITTGTADVVLSDVGTGSAAYWIVGSSATLGADTEFEGNILASTSITLDAGATITCGSALANTGAATLDNNTIGNGCNGAPTGGGVTVSGDVVTVSLGEGTPPLVATPEPGTFMLFGAGIACLVAWRRASARGRSETWQLRPDPNARHAATL